MVVAKLIPNLVAPILALLLSLGPVFNSIRPALGQPLACGTLARGWPSVGHTWPGRGGAGRSRATLQKIGDRRWAALPCRSVCNTAR